MVQVSSATDGPIAEDCIEIDFYKVNGGGHDWPGAFGNMDIVSHEVIWDHLKEYNMEGQMSCATSRINDLETQEWKISPNPTSMALTVTFGEGATPDGSTFSMSEGRFAWKQALSKAPNGPLTLPA